MKRLKNKVVMVTGGAAGLGKAIVSCFIAEGAKVIITDIDKISGDGLSLDLGCKFIQQDVTDEAQWQTIVQKIETEYGALHVLVNNAGIEGPMKGSNASPETTDLKDWQRVQQVNVDGIFLGCRAVIPVMRRAGGGSIINMSSVAALVPTPEHVAYGLSKAAVRHLTKSVAMHCATDGSKIRCNSIHPGTIMTPMLERIIVEKANAKGITQQAMTAELRAETPQDVFQEPKDIAAAALFLASDEARYITGMKMVVDGGYAMSS
jgi:3(or 17)beta-hydroxysteroid dehydrogenase